MDSGGSFCTSRAEWPEPGPTMFLVSPIALEREGLKLVLQRGGYRIIGEAPSLEGLESASQPGAEPQMILIGLLESEDPAAWRIPLKTLRQRRPTTRIALLAPTARPEWLSICREALLDGFLLKDRAWPILDRELRLILSGVSLASTNLLKDSVGSDLTYLRSDIDTASSPALSSPEIELLRCLSEGLSDQLIAQRLNLKFSTVKTQLKFLRRKLGTSNRTATAVWAHEHGVSRRIEPSERRVEDPRSSVKALDGNGESETYLTGLLSRRDGTPPSPKCPSGKILGPLNHL